MRKLLFFFKGVIVYLVFSSFCVGVTLLAMRHIALRAGKPGLFRDWIGEMGDAFREAGDFISESYARFESRNAKHAVKK
jgi:hypothetical protein